MSKGFKNESKQLFSKITRHPPDCQDCCKFCVCVCTWGCWAGSPVWRWAPPCWSDLNWVGWSRSDHCVCLCPLKIDHKKGETSECWPNCMIQSSHTACVCACFTWQEGQFLLEDREDGGRFHVDVGHLLTHRWIHIFQHSFLWKSPDLLFIRPVKPHICFSKCRFVDTGPKSPPKVQKLAHLMVHWLGTSPLAQTLANCFNH